MEDLLATSALSMQRRTARRSRWWKPRKSAVPALSLNFNAGFVIAECDGDITDRVLLAHVASAQTRVAVDHMLVLALRKLNERNIGAE